MTFNTYVINLKKDTKKWNQIQEDFRNTGIHLNRFNAIYGKKMTKEDLEFKKENTTTGCKLFCTDGIIGCGLSHIKLAEKILKEDTNDFALILEDDVSPRVNNFKDEIYKAVERAPKDWDIIKIYYHGFCKYPNNLFWMCGSSAGYLISKRGAKKISELKLDNHIDIQYQQSSNVNVFLHNKRLLRENILNSNLSENSFLQKYDNFKIYDHLKLNPISWYLNNSIFNIPYLNFNVTWIKLLLIALFIGYFLNGLHGIKIVLSFPILYLVIGFLFFKTYNIAKIIS